MKRVLGLIFFASLIFQAQAIQVQASTEKAPLKIGVLLYEGAELIDFAGPHEVFGAAGFELFTISQNGNAVNVWPKMTIQPQYSFETAPELDALLVPGGNAGNATGNKHLMNWLKEKAHTTKQIISVCTGAFILADAGLLNGLNATTFYPALDELEEHEGKITVLKNKRFVDDGKIITAAGLSSGIDAALYFVSKIQGIQSARTIAMQLEYDWKPENGFVRGKMADSVLPKMGNTIKLQRRYSYGDESSWFASFDIEEENIKTLEHEVTEQMVLHRDWLPVDGIRSTWTKAINKNSRWVLEIKHSHDEDLPTMEVYLSQQNISI